MRPTLGRKFILTGFAATALTALVLLLLVDPVKAGWMPKCVFKMATGLDCPSCGASRATHALLHGHFAEALAYNYFLVVGLAYAAFAALVAFVPCLHQSRLRKIVFSRSAGLVYVALFFAWWIVRNLNWYKDLI